MSKYIWVDSIYPDWFREPLSPLEQTWVVPLAFREANKLVKGRLGICIPADLYSIREGWVFLKHDLFQWLKQPPIILASIRLFKRIPKEIIEFRSRMIPQYQSLIRSWASKDLAQKNTRELWEFAQRVMNEDIPLALEVAYVGIYSFAFEALVKVFFKRFVDDDPVAYHDLLVGFENRTLEMNRELFRLSRVQNQDKFQKDFQKFLQDFGYKKSDWEIVLPTFAESPDAIVHLIELYRKNPGLDPDSTFQAMKDRRSQEELYAKQHLKYSFVSRPIFSWILKWAQEYVPLRETRQHYIRAGGFWVRKALRAIALKVGLEQDLIYYVTYNELKRVIEGTCDMNEIRDSALGRFSEREMRKEHPPTI